MSKSTAALVITNSHQLGKSLQILLQSLPCIDVVHQVKSYPAARQMSGISPPILILFDISGRTEWSTTIRDLKTDWPGAKMIVLVDNEQQQQAAQAAGADLICLKGINAENLLATIEGLLLRPGAGFDEITNT